jgi:hypothetical protein
MHLPRVRRISLNFPQFSLLTFSTHPRMIRHT